VVSGKSRAVGVAIRSPRAGRRAAARRGTRPEPASCRPWAPRFDGDTGAPKRTPKSATGRRRGAGRFGIGRPAGSRSSTSTPRGASAGGSAGGDVGQPAGIDERVELARAVETRYHPGDADSSAAYRGGSERSPPGRAMEAPGHHPQRPRVDTSGAGCGDARSTTNLDSRAWRATSTSGKE